MGRVGGGLLSIGDQILYRLPSFIGLSFAGPRFWHNGVMLRRAEFWLCWKASPFWQGWPPGWAGPELRVM